MIKDVCKIFLPTSLKTKLKPIYYRYFGPPKKIIISTTPIEIANFGGFEIAFRKNSVDESVIAHSFENDIFFTNVPEYKPSNDDIIIDVGAHIGTFSLLAASKVPNGTVYAIEACKETFNLLRINVMLNHIKNINISHLALSNEKGFCTLHHDESGNWGNRIVGIPTESSERVPMDTLKNFFTAQKITRCDFLKFNCEGAEFPIILSTPPEELRKIKIMLVLYHSDLYQLANEEVLIGHLTQSGFTTLIRNKENQRGWIIAINNRL